MSPTASATTKRPRSALRTIFRNIASNTVGYFINTVVALVLSPYLVRTLGESSYGIWSLIIAITGHYGLLDLGIRSAVGHYVAVYDARKDQASVNRVMNTAMVLTWIAAAIAIVLTLVLVTILPTWKPKAVAAEPNLQLAMLIMGLGFAMSFPLAIFGTVLYAKQRIDLQNTIGVSQKLLSTALIVLFLQSGHGVLGMAVAVTSCNVLGWAANIVLARRLMPGLRFAPRLFQRGAVRQLGDYGFFNFIVNASDNILVFTDSLVIGLFIWDESAITYYVIGANLVPYYMSIVFAVTWAFTPYATALYATGDQHGLQKLMITGTRGALMLGALIGGGLMLVGHDFLAVWMDPKFLTGRVYASSALILAILAAATLLRASQSVGRQILFATQEVRFLGMLACGEAVANLVLSVILVQKLGLVGVALGSLIPILITQGLIQPVFLMRRLGLSLSRFYLQVLRILVSVIGTMDLAYWLAARHIEVHGWWDLGLKSLTLAVPAVLVGFVIGLGRDEKRWVLARLRRRSVAAAGSAPSS